MVTLVVIGEYGYNSYLILEHEDGTEVNCLLKKIVQEAIEDGMECTDASEIPEKYFNKYGIKKIDFTMLETLPKILAPEKEYEKAGIHIACCRDCLWFDSGSCFKYGCAADPDSENDCCHGDEIYQLIYEDEDNLEYLDNSLVTLDRDICPEDIKLLANEDFPDVKRFLENKEDIDFNAFRFEKKLY